MQTLEERFEELKQERKTALETPPLPPVNKTKKISVGLKNE